MAHPLGDFVVPSSQLWIPGAGLVPPHIRTAQKAVEEYDAGLMLGRHEVTGDWVVMVKDGPEGRPFPVFGLGKELPGPDEIKKRLYQADTKRHGAKIVADIERKNAAARKALHDKASEGSGQAAEAFSWAHRKMGSHPSPRVFVPKDVP